MPTPLASVEPSGVSVVGASNTSEAQKYYIPMDPRGSGQPAMAL